MHTLIIPACGLSTRFPLTRPKYMLTHPHGGSMLINSISGLDLSNVDKIIVAILDEHEQKYEISTLLTQELEKTDKPFIIYRLAQRTNSQVETILRTISLADL